MAGGEGTGQPVVPRPVQDAGIAIGVALLGLSSGLGAGRPGQHVPALGVTLLTTMGLVLYPRRRFPGTVLVLMAALVAGLVALHTSLEAAFIAVLVASYSAAVYGSQRLARTLVIAAAVALLGLGIPSALGWGGWLRAHIPVPTMLAAAGAWVVGLMVRRQLAARAEHIATLAERAELIAGQQEERARRATLAERLRIARELHDIVAHHLSVVVIQAQGAQRIAGQDLERATAAMADVERTGRTALEEMRRLLGLLRSGEPAGQEDPAGQDDREAAAGDAYLPPLGLADVDDLAERIRGAGLPVTVVRHGEPRDVPEDVGLTVYRIVQEALTNVLKHAGPAAATVELTMTPSPGCPGATELGVTVTDDGRGASAALSGTPQGTPGGIPGAGRGMAGMRERVAALGGKLSIGPRPGGGYRVHATIPLEGT
jgi:signal transduction histidine kinase